jgi:NitT/TauT family transport system substrate-binding protein
MKKQTIVLGLLLLGALLSACSAPATVTEVPVEMAPLRIALLPSTEMLPFFVAQDQGYFDEEGITVEHVPAASAAERDQLMQAGEIDGMVGELPSTMAFNRDQVQVKSVYITRKPTEGHTLFSVVVGPTSEVKTVQDLAGVPIGLSLNTVNEYATFTMLTQAGLSPEDFATESVPAIPERLQLVMSGQLGAATLVEPFTTAAVAGGAHVVASDANMGDLVTPVLTFSVSALDNNGAAVRAFLKAWNRAAADLNADPEPFRAVMNANIPLPEPLQQAFSIPTNWSTGEVPSQAAWDGVQTWMIDKGLIDGPISYTDSVTDEYLP